ncbi:hypothetical protein CKO08_03695 [Halorhodospira halochloris]|nr:hypothetical protein [Halorhodospira halochloris]
MNSTDWLICWKNQLGFNATTALNHLLLFFLLLAGISPTAQAAAIGSPAGWAAAGSLILPGSGQLYNHQPVRAAGHFSTFLGSGIAASYYYDRDDFIEFDDRYDEDEEIIYTNRTTERAEVAERVMLSSMFYSSYDAYMQRRLMQDNLGYRTPAHYEFIQELALAPFNREYLTRWTTLVPIGIAASALTLGADDSWVTERKDGMTRDEAAAYQFPKHGAVAIGEEAFFRGVLNNSFSHQWGEWWGLTASSVSFGLAHTGDGMSADAGVATVFGAYLGWVHQRNDYRMAESVAIHFWWNVFVSLAALRHDPEDRTARVAIELPF